MLRNVIINDEINGVSELAVDNGENITELSKLSSGATTITVNDNINQLFDMVQNSFNGNHLETKRHNQVVDNKTFTAKFYTYAAMLKDFDTKANGLAERYEAVKKFQTKNNLSTNETNIDLHSMVIIKFYSF